MKVDIINYCLKDGEFKERSKWHHIWQEIEMVEMINKWYKRHPYAKRLNKYWICGDYRIDQQRPQRNVISDNYIKIISISEMEEMKLTKLITSLESQINYPTMWDDGKNEYYEETIYCPQCGKRRKVLTSKIHCEFCGFEFEKAKKCPKCNNLNLKENNYCIHCGHKFIEKKANEIIRCPKCGRVKSEYDTHCRMCNFDFSKYTQCPKCGKLTEKRNYCLYCGEKLQRIKCSECGEKNNLENKYCKYCGNNLRK